MEPEIVSIAPAEPRSLAEKQVAAIQKQKQLESILKDLEEFLPVIQEGRQHVAQLFLKAFFATDEVDRKAVEDGIVKWMRTHPKDAAATISTLNAIADSITHPQQLRSNSKKRIRLLFGKDQGVEITE